MVLDASLLNTQLYMVRIKGKVEQSREWSNAPLHLGVVAIEKEAFGSPSTKVANFTYSWERYEAPYPPSYWLNSTTTVLQEGWLICH